MRIYHMIVEPAVYIPGDNGNRRKEYLSTHQGAHPDGYRTVGVCGFHDRPDGEKKRFKPHFA